MRRGATGLYELAAVGGAQVRPFVPAPLPPDPPVELGPLQTPLEQAPVAEGRLDALQAVLPDTAVFLYAYGREEAARSSQIDGSRPGTAHFVPPPAPAVPDCPSDLEESLHDRGSHLPAPIRAILVHLPFETVHPSLDGNGRVERLLITLLLCHDGLLRDSLLYLSLYLKQHRDDDYALLEGVRRNGDRKAWLNYFLKGVAYTASGALATAQRLLSPFRTGQERIQRQGRQAGSALRVHQMLQARPITSLPDAVGGAGLSFPAVSPGIQLLERLGIARELTGIQRNRLYGYQAYLDILNEGMEPP